MTIVQLEYLLAVVNSGNFSRAAELCFVTQPSLSLQIKNLEEELGVVLLDRTRKPVIPTEIGAVVIENAREALRACGYIAESVKELKDEVSGTLRLAVIPTVAAYMLPRIIGKFTAACPKVELEVSEMSASEIKESLLRDRIDAAIVSGGDFGSMIEYELFNDTFFAYVSNSHPLAARGAIRLDDIPMRDMVLLREGYCLRDQVIDLFSAKRMAKPMHKFSCASLESVMRIVDATGGLTIIPEMVTKFISGSKRRQIKILAKGALSRKISLVVRRTYVKGSIITALREIIK